MLISKKQKISAIFLLIVLIASVTLMTNPIVKAQVSATQPTTTVPSGVTPDITITTQARISFRPNPVGLGQTFLVNIWTDPAPAFNRRQLGYSVTITKPDGSKAVLNMTSNADDGTNWFEYVADQIGTWQLQFSFAGNYDPAGNYCKALKWITRQLRPMVVSLLMALSTLLQAQPHRHPFTCKKTQYLHGPQLNFQPTTGLDL